MTEYAICFPCLAGDHDKCAVTVIIPDTGDETPCMCASHDHLPRR